MQAQDYAQSKWAIGLRLPNYTDAEIEKAISAKRIVRTWAMRSTLQFVAAKDYRWILSLVAPKRLAAGKSRNKQLALDDKILERTNTLIVRALEKEYLLTRDEINKILVKAKISTDQNRLSHILQHSVLNQLTCFGPRKGKEFTFVLLEKWIPSQNFFRKKTHYKKLLYDILEAAVLQH